MATRLHIREMVRVCTGMPCRFFPALMAALFSGSGGIAPARFLPQAKSSYEGIGVVARSAPWRELLQFLDVASSQNHVLGFQSGHEAGYHVRHVLPPFLLPSRSYPRTPT